MATLFLIIFWELPVIIEISVCDDGIFIIIIYFIIVIIIERGMEILGSSNKLWA